MNQLISFHECLTCSTNVLLRFIVTLPSVKTLDPSIHSLEMNLSSCYVELICAFSEQLKETRRFSWPMVDRVRKETKAVKAFSHNSLCIRVSTCITRFILNSKECIFVHRDAELLNLYIDIRPSI